MNDAIIQKALEQVLADMKTAAMRGKRSMFMKPSPVAAVMVDDPSADPSKPITDEDDPLANDPAAPDDESDPNDPSDDEIEALLAAKGR